MGWEWRPDAEAVFVCDGRMLPAWRLAFPGAEVRRIGDVAPARLVWLRLRSGPLEAQVEQAGLSVGGVPWIALSDRPGDDEAALALAQGARGYCNAHADERQLRQVARVVELGGLWIGGGLMQRLLRSAAAIPAPAAGADELLAELSGREAAVAVRAARGDSNKEIGRELGITERTVKMYMAAILDKLGVRDRLQLALRLRGASADAGLAEAVVVEPRRKTGA